MARYDVLAQQPKGGDILTISFGTALAMWTIGYLGRLPGVMVDGRLLLAFMLLCQLVAGWLSARTTVHGWRGGAAVGSLSAVLNLLILGSLLISPHDERVIPSALWWMPGSIAVGFVFGTLGALLGRINQPRSTQNNWACAFAIVAVLATALLLVAGGLVTGFRAGLAVVDWPNSFGMNMFLYPLSRMTGDIYLEHSHRLLGSFAGLTTIALTIHLWRVDSRRWLRGLSLVAVILVVVQGILGGLRVTGQFTLSDDPDVTSPDIRMAIIHGVTGQLFFALLVGIAVFTSNFWHRAHPISTGVSTSDRGLSITVIILLIAQLVIGAVLRHTAGGLHLHITLGVLTAIVGLIAAVRAWGVYANHSPLPRLGVALIWLIVAQLCLGVAALVVTKQPDIPLTADALVTTVHQIVGAGLLALATILMLVQFRLTPRDSRKTAGAAPRVIRA